MGEVLEALVAEWRPGRMRLLVGKEDELGLELDLRGSAAEVGDREGGWPGQRDSPQESSAESTHGSKPANATSPIPPARPSVRGWTTSGEDV